MPYNTATLKLNEIKYDKKLYFLYIIIGGILSQNGFDFFVIFHMGKGDGMNLVMAIGEDHMLLMSATQLSLMCTTSALSHIVKSNLIVIQD